MEGIVGSSFQGGLKAIAETTRLRIIRLLVKHGELCVNDIAKSLGLTQGKISQHLRVMKFQEIVRTRKKSQKIIVRGQLVDADGYKDITTKITEMKAEVTTDLGVLKMEHYDGGWQVDWSYTVYRIDEIRFPKSLRTSSQKYEVSFLVVAY